MNQVHTASKAPVSPRDPVCGMAVSDDTDNRMTYEGREYLFCSEHCLHKFKHSPQQYIEPKAAPAPESTSMLYTCPMHPEVQLPGPGSCPKCGMALEPRTIEAEEDNAELRDMSWRFRVSAALAIPVFFSAMAAEFWPAQMAEIIAPVCASGGRGAVSLFRHLALAYDRGGGYEL